MAAGAIGGAVSRHRKNKQLKKLIKKTPKYEINEEAYDNQALAKSRAFGRDRSIQKAQEEVDLNAANASAEARDITTSTSDLLSTVAAISSQRDAAKRGLAADEAAIQNQNINALYAANLGLIDEKDKKFHQNKVVPHQNQMNLLQARKEEANSAWGAIFQSGASMMGGAMGGGK